MIAYIIYHVTYYISAYVSISNVLKNNQSPPFPFLEILCNHTCYPLCKPTPQMLQKLSIWKHFLFWKCYIIRHNSPLHNPILHSPPFSEIFLFWKYYIISHMISLCNPTNLALHHPKYTQIHPNYLILPPQFTLPFSYVVITSPCFIS